MFANAVLASGFGIGHAFRASMDANGRATFTDLGVSSPSSSIRFSYTMIGLPSLGFIGSELPVSGPASGIRPVVQPSRASPGLVLAQQPHLELHDKDGIRVMSHGVGALLPVPSGSDVAPSFLTHVVAVDAMAHTTRASSGAAEVITLQLLGRTRLVITRGRAEFTDVDLSFVGTCLQMRFFAKRFPSAEEALKISHAVASPAGILETFKLPFSTASAKLEVVIGSSHSLVPQVQPAMAAAGAVFLQQPLIAVHDAGRNVVQLDQGSPVTALHAIGETSLLQGGAGKIVASKQGIVTFTNLRLDQGRAGC